MKDSDCVEFLQKILPRMEMRWEGFRRVRKQVCKRLSRRMEKLSIEFPPQYQTFLEENPDEWDVLRGLCRITISRFFRDRRVFEIIGTKILPKLSRLAHENGEANIYAWSAGCASGEEPYSLKLAWRFLAEDRAADVGLLITATDSDPKMIERALDGIYKPSGLKELPEKILRGAFARRNGSFVLKTGYRSGIKFIHQDILEEMPGGDFHLILCRNLVFTYFSQKLQRELLLKISEKLIGGGALVLGGHESLPVMPETLRPWPGEKCIFIKNG